MKNLPAQNINSRKIILFLDFDGTLSPIVSHPRGARLPPKTKECLRILHRRGVKIGIVTGRILKDIRKRVGLPNLIYAANHGLEIFHKGRFLLKRGRQFERPIARLGRELDQALAHIPRLLLEKKGLSVAVHYRLVNRKYHSQITKLVRKISRPWRRRYNLQLTGGKMVWEVRPSVHWNKGKAVLWLWRRLGKGCLPFYVGDDVTDEAAFKALRGKGITICVGLKPRSAAQYYLNSPAQVTTFLRSLIKALD